MKEIKILSLNIENFKGIRQLTLQLNGDNATLYGDNATGKSSVYDALTWLLFSKDSCGNTRFSIKPLDVVGNTLPGVMPTVTGRMDINGTQLTLRKQLREKWEKHRGGEERYAGNTVDHYIDDIPVKENRYKAAVAELVDEDMFRMLTSVHRFCREVKWQDRRKVLFELACVESDVQLLKAPRFDGLRAEIGNHTVDDFKAMLAKQRKDTNGQLNLLPARIDECEKQLAELPTTFDQAKISELSETIDGLCRALAALDNAEARNAKRNDIRAAELELQELEAENQQYRRSQSTPVPDRRGDIQRAIGRLECSNRHTKADLERRRKNIADADEQLQYLRDRWHAEKSTKYTGGTCPTCGQELPEVMEKQAREKFEKNKKQTLDRLVEDSKYTKQRKATDEESVAGLEKAIQDTDVEIATLQKELEATEAPREIIIEDLTDYAERKETLCKKISDLRADLNDWDACTDAERRRLHYMLDDAQREKAEQNMIAANAALRTSVAARIEELEQERRAKAAYIEHIDDLIDQCEGFTRYKVERVSSAVNEQFGLTSFRLFTEAINGSLQDCCDAMVDGVPYSDLNSAMQINAGLDCIQTLSEFYSVRVPVFVDNAESVTKLHNLDTQVIRLVVSENDKELRCEV